MRISGIFGKICTYSVARISRPLPRDLDNSFEQVTPRPQNSFCLRKCISLSNYDDRPDDGVINEDET